MWQRIRPYGHVHSNQTDNATEFSRHHHGAAPRRLKEWGRGGGNHWFKRGQDFTSCFWCSKCYCKPTQSQREVQIATGICHIHYQPSIISLYECRQLEERFQFLSLKMWFLLTKWQAFFQWKKVVCCRKSHPFEERAESQSVTKAASLRRLENTQELNSSCTWESSRKVYLRRYGWGDLVFKGRFKATEDRVKTLRGHQWTWLSDAVPRFGYYPMLAVRFLVLWWHQHPPPRLITPAFEAKLHYPWAVIFLPADKHHWWRCLPLVGAGTTLACWR